MPVQRGAKDFNKYLNLKIVNIIKYFGVIGIRLNWINVPSQQAIPSKLNLRSLLFECTTNVLRALNYITASLIWKCATVFAR